MSPNIDEDKGPTPIVCGEGIGIYEHNNNFNLRIRCHDISENIYKFIHFNIEDDTLKLKDKFIDINVNVPHSIYLG